MTASGNRPRSAKKAKTSSQTIFYTLDTRLHLQHAYVQELLQQYRKPARAARGGAYNGRTRPPPISPEMGGGGGGGCNSEQGVIARQYGIRAKTSFVHSSRHAETTLVEVNAKRFSYISESRISKNWLTLYHCSR